MSDTTAEIVDLESWLDAKLVCQSKKAHDCKVDATHLANSCNRLDIPVCDGLVSLKLRQMEAGNTCWGCKRLAADCWTYRPI